MHHHVKAAPQFFRSYAAGTKQWSMRFNDRQYQPGDTVSFYEWVDEQATGADTGRFEVTEVWRYLDWLPEGHVMLSLRPIEEVPDA